MRRTLLAWLLAAPFVALAGPATAVAIDWAPVGDPGNAPDAAANCDAAGCGSVPYDYFISRFEVTNAQYAEFLNAKAASDPFGLYHASMGSNVSYGGITQSGASGSYTYAAKVGSENLPVNYVSFWDALRFANWLHNGQGSGDTETGAYTLTPDGIANNTVTRTPGALVFLPSESEWYKAAYYDPALPGYYDYPTATDTPPTCAAPGSTPNTANCGNLAPLTEVGAYTGSPSPYGSFDQGGNVFEWNEEIVDAASRGCRGGSRSYGADRLAAAYLCSNDPAAEFQELGFRVATLVPEPGKGLLAVTGALVLAAARRRLAKAP
jgi:formylglycine-generating enzyme